MISRATFALETLDRVQLPSEPEAVVDELKAAMLLCESGDVQDAWAARDALCRMAVLALEAARLLDARLP